MAETSLLRSSAIPRNASPKYSAASAHTERSNTLPMVQVNMNNGRPQQSGSQAAPGRNVHVFPIGQKPGVRGAAPPRPVAHALTTEQLELCKEALAELGKKTDLAPEKAQQVAICASMIDEQLAAERDAVAAATAPKQVAVGPGNRSVAGALSPRRIPRRRLSAEAPPPVAVTMDNGKPVLEG